jgi:hypothetical protein
VHLNVLSSAPTSVRTIQVIIVEVNHLMPPTTAGGVGMDGAAEISVELLDVILLTEFSDNSANFFCRVCFADQFCKLRKLIFPDGEERYRTCSAQWIVCDSSLLSSCKQRSV